MGRRYYDDDDDDDEGGGGFMTWMIVILIFLLVVGVGVLVWWLYKKNKELEEGGSSGGGSGGSGGGATDPVEASKYEMTSTKCELSGVTLEGWYKAKNKTKVCIAKSNDVLSNSTDCCEKSGLYCALDFNKNSSASAVKDRATKCDITFTHDDDKDEGGGVDGDEEGSGGGDDDGEDETVETKGAEDDECTGNEDCQTGLVCLKQTCVPPTQTRVGGKCMKDKLKCGNDPLNARNLTCQPKKTNEWGKCYYDPAEEGEPCLKGRKVECKGKLKCSGSKDVWGICQ